MRSRSSGNFPVFKKADSPHTRTILSRFKRVLIATFVSFATISIWSVYPFIDKSRGSVAQRFLLNSKYYNNDENDYDDFKHVCLIFDSKRTQYALGALNSLIVVSRNENRSVPSLHLIITATQQSKIKASWKFYQEYRDQVFFYDFERCKSLGSEARAFAPTVHIAAHCKLYIHSILPPNVRSVLFVDNDIAFRKHPRFCMPRWRSSEMISMAPDMGDICLTHNERCFPTGFVARVPPKLVCGNDENRKTSSGSCPATGEIVSFYFNGGVIYLNLEAMRKSNFTSMYQDHIWKATFAQGLRPAEWGEQCYINSFFAEYPETLRMLPCSCNYQFTAQRRRVICPKKYITILHAWKYGINTSDPYSRYLSHFHDCNGEDCFLNIPRVKSLSADSHVKAEPFAPVHVKVSAPLKLLKKPLFSIITRTADRPNMLHAAISSVQDQIYQNFVHIIGIELSDNNTHDLTSAPPKSVIVPLESSSPIDPDEPCKVCHSKPGRCFSAPPLSQPHLRKRFLDCFCSLNFQSNGAFEILHKYVAPDSYIIYLDDDNMLVDTSTLLKLANVIANTEDSKDTLFIVASHLGRITPTAEAMRSRTLSQGDIDSSNLVFHSSHIAKNGWGNTRCGDWRTAKNLYDSLSNVWISEFLLIAANPLLETGVAGRGGGMKRDGSKITVMVTSIYSTGHRPGWLYNAVSKLISNSYKHVVGEVIVVWNNPLEDPPAFPAGVRILRTTKNSLNNRWTVALNAATYGKILNLDDDLEISISAIMCMFDVLRARPRAIVGSYVRYFTENGSYSINELRDYDKSYRMVLPRVLMASKTTLMAYSKWSHLFQYVDDQAAHCDDVLLNLAVVENRGEVLRVALPEGSVGDYWQSCMNEEGVKQAGISGQNKRVELRSECIHDLLNHLPLPPLKKESYQCASYGLISSKSKHGYPKHVYTSSIYLPECA